MGEFNIGVIREQFPALGRTVGDCNAVFLDGPAGSQVPVRVAEEMTRVLLHCNANEGGVFATSEETDALVEDGIATVASFYGVQDRNIVFGPNMTTLTFSFTRAVSQTLKPGDEVIVSTLDHDANVTPWVVAAKEAGATVRYIPLNEADCTLDMEAYRALLGPKTRWVAVGVAANSTGTVNPVREISALAHEVGAQVYVDAVHFGPHGLIDIPELGCDALVASAYKFFGPHMGMLWAREAHLLSLPAYKVRPATEELPFRWMTGTPSFSGIAGTAEAIRYIASLGEDATDLRTQLQSAFERIRAYELSLMVPLIEGLSSNPEIKIWGITDPERYDERVPTISFTHARVRPREIAVYLAERGIFSWSGNNYALQFTESVGLEPNGAVRVGLLHYNTLEEVQRLVEAIGAL